LNERLSVRYKNRNLSKAADLPKIGRPLATVQSQIDGPILVL
jgi:hypothetical protein